MQSEGGEGREGDGRRGEAGCARGWISHPSVAVKEEGTPLKTKHDCVTETDVPRRV